MLTAFALQDFHPSKSPSPIRERSLLFVDSRIDGPEILLAGVRADVEGIVLTAQCPGLEQIDTVLRSRAGVREIHIVSHGEPGRFQLGADWVDAQLLERYAEMLGHWREFLTEEAEISIYSCRVASEAAGLRLLLQLR